MVEKQLAAEDYYHGLLPREDIKQMLRANGDFLVRTTEPAAGQPRAFVLSVMVVQPDREGVKHFIIQRINGKVVIERGIFDSIPEMINHHLKSGESVSKSIENIILRTSVPRQQWELLHERIEVTKKLGEGAFGEVSLGRLMLDKDKKTGVAQMLEVAIKLAKLESLTKEQIKEIMHEARIMRPFDHPNVIKLYGVAALQEPLMLVLELADGGALDSYLKKNVVIPEKKCEMCAGASFGMDYLHNVANVIHRDIAARNCLFGGGKVKIADFGLAREGTVFQMEPGSKVPIRWLAPEILRTAIYSQKSDVFSYGIMCWEIFANGNEPYEGMKLAEVNAKVKDGYRMPFPPGTPEEVSAVVLQKCWPENLNERWTMDEMSAFWESFGYKRPRVKGKYKSSHKSTYSIASKDTQTKKKKKERSKKTAVTANGSQSQMQTD